jgi:hypothetical protein
VLVFKPEVVVEDEHHPLGNDRLELQAPVFPALR